MDDPFLQSDRIYEKYTIVMIRQLITSKKVKIGKMLTTMTITGLRDDEQYTQYPIIRNTSIRNN